MCKWASHNFTEDQKDSKANFCKSFLEKYEYKNKNIYDIVTGGEKQLRFWDPKIVNIAKAWKLEECNTFEATKNLLETKK